MAGTDGSDEVSSSDFIDEVGGGRGQVPRSERHLLINDIAERFEPYFQAHQQWIENLVRERTSLKSQLQQKEDILSEKEREMGQLIEKAGQVKEQKEEIKKLKEEIKNLNSTILAKEEEIKALSITPIQPSRPRPTPISPQGSEKDRAKEMKLLREEEEKLNKRLKSHKRAKEEVTDKMRIIKGKK